MMTGWKRWKPILPPVTAAEAIDQIFYAFGLRNSGDIDLQPSLPGTRNADLANVEYSLEKSLVQLHVSDVLVPDLGNGF